MAVGESENSTGNRLYDEALESVDVHRTKGELYT